MILVTADSVCGTVVGNVYHNVKVCTADRFLNDSLALTSTKTGALTVYKERLLTVALGNVVQTFFFYQFLTEFYQFSVDLLCKIAAIRIGATGIDFSSNSMFGMIFLLSSMLIVDSVCCIKIGQLSFICRPLPYIYNICPK